MSDMIVSLRKTAGLRTVPGSTEASMLSPSSQHMMAGGAAIICVECFRPEKGSIVHVSQEQLSELQAWFRRN